MNTGEALMGGAFTPFGITPQTMQEVEAQRNKELTAMHEYDFTNNFLGK